MSSEIDIYRLVPIAVWDDSESLAVLLRVCKASQVTYIHSSAFFVNIDAHTRYA